MNQPIKFTTKRMSPARNSVNHSLPRRSFSEGGSLIASHYSLLTVLLLACFRLGPAPNAFGVSPAPDGGYASGNTAEGTNALFSRTTGVWNTALGYQALYHVTTGNQNTATGYQTLFRTTTGSLSVANGSQALFDNATGFDNTANGWQALYSNTTGYESTASGFGALFGNTASFDNTASGFGALGSSTTGSHNIALGDFAGSNLTTGSDNIDIGNNGVAAEANTIRIGDSNNQTPHLSLASRAQRSQARPSISILPVVSLAS